MTIAVVSITPEATAAQAARRLHTAKAKRLSVVDYRDQPPVGPKVPREQANRALPPRRAAGDAGSSSETKEHVMPATVAMTLDLRGPTLDLTVARTAVAMTRLRSGELLEVLTSDPDEAQDLSVWARATRHRLIQQTKDDGVYRFVLEKR
jgi:tRNA 2-thiouridine synthesizing protein A